MVVLWSPRSDASVQLGDALASLAADDGGKWSLVNVNVDTTPRVAQIFGVQAVPTVVALAAGQPLSSFQGLQPPDQLRGWIDSLLNATAGKLGGGRSRPTSRSRSTPNWHRRVRIWTPVTSTPRSPPTRRSSTPTPITKRPRALCARSRSSPAHPRCRRKRSPAADAAPDDIEAAFAAADVEILQQNVAAAFDRLIALVRRTAGDERTTVRTRLIELFDLFDPADPEVIAGRRNLANALY